MDLKGATITGAVCGVNKTVGSWNTSNDSEVPGNDWDQASGEDTVKIVAIGLLVRPVPGEMDQFYRVGLFAVQETRESWWFSAPKPDAYLSSVDFLPGVGYTITVI